MSFGGGANPVLPFQMQTNQMFGMAQFQAAGQEGALERQQAGYVLDMSEAEAIRREREGRLFAASQEEAYAAGGVLMDGSPLAVVSETKRLNQQEVGAIRLAGRAEADKMLLGANQVESQGLQSLLGAQAENTVSKLQDEERQRQQRMQMFGGIFNTALSLGSSLMGSL